MHSALRMSTYALHTLDNSNVLSYSVDLLLPVYALYSLISHVYGLSLLIRSSLLLSPPPPLLLLLSFAFTSSSVYVDTEMSASCTVHTAFSGFALFILFLLDDFVVVFVSWRFRMHPECIEREIWQSEVRDRKKQQQQQPHSQLNEWRTQHNGILCIILCHDALCTRCFIPNLVRNPFHLKWFELLVDGVGCFFILFRIVVVVAVVVLHWICSFKLAVGLFCNLTYERGACSMLNAHCKLKMDRSTFAFAHCWDTERTGCITIKR